MISSTRHIHISPEIPLEDAADCNVYVIVTFPDGSRWASDFYTYRNIESIREDYVRSGACLSGAYWPAPSSLTVADHLGRERIEEIVDLYIQEGTFEYSFEYIGQVTEHDLESMDYPEDLFNPEEKFDPSYVMRQFASFEQMLGNTTPETIEWIKKRIAGK
ncbi:hypothetical protein GCM10010912_64540 [Paenibacillus albidus]|uniref:DUF4375 domain-containing protein n=1 Tax=Paenibacillus albidus TaxID=2041023 RepID=A0A917D3R4_9BACL|nr:hypothetical protein [Paenibacillus albidus]GGG11210.1 hypothetical protein GCM10010912_64540 [Paenibacillus albidus]